MTSDSLLAQFGLDISFKNIVSPLTSVVWLSIVIDSFWRTISIPEEKITRNYVDYLMLQHTVAALFGSLLYIAKCVSPLNCMLQMLRDNHLQNIILISPEFKKDLNWLNTPLLQYNRTPYYDQRICHTEVYLDDWLTGLGGNFFGLLSPSSKSHMTYNILHLENGNKIVVLNILAVCLSNQRIKVHCHNMTVMEVLKNCGPKDATVANFARKILLVCVIFKDWGLNPLFLPSCCILLNNITKITNKCLVVINGPIISSLFLSSIGEFHLNLVWLTLMS